MNGLEQLPKIVNQQLGGLEATPTILAKAKLRASEYKQSRMQRTVGRPIFAACAALVLCVGAVVWTTNGNVPVTLPAPTENVLDSRSAGDRLSPTTAPELSAIEPVGSISMSAGSRTVQTLFADLQGNSFPLISVNDATYRLLDSPNGISESIMGEVLGNVNEFNREPALGSDGIVSNIVLQGETVYAVSGLSGALIVAKVDGTLRVFQRVSYAGTAIIGNETLGDTLCSASDVQWITLNGVDTVTDVDDVQSLMQVLLDNAEYQGTSMSGTGSLQLGLTNGLTLQLLVGDDTVSACGMWSAPDFFQAFHEAVGK